MPQHQDYAYSVFISYRWVTPDKEWVREQLVPSLKNAGLKVFVDVEDFVPGRDLILEMERAGIESRHVLCIVTPEYFEDGRMVEFESLSARRRDPGGRNSFLIPLILRETKVPDRFGALIPIYWTNPVDHGREWRKLLHVLGAEKNDVTRPGVIQPKEEPVSVKAYQEEIRPDAEELDDDDWQFLVDRINDKSCTPIIGPGIYTKQSPYQSLISEWTKAAEYPFKEFTNLTLAAQFRSLKYGSIEPKGKIIKRLEEIGSPDFTSPDESHAILARFPFYNYITTNYDDYLFKALEFQKKQPRRDFCRWDDPQNCEQLSVFKTGYNPDEENPVVFHLYGYSLNKKALVLTEDDYLDFLANVSRFAALIPPKIQEALTNSSVLLLGYTLDDLDFKILFRTLVNYLKLSPFKTHLSIQLSPFNGEMPADQARKAKTYFKRYLEDHNIRVSWKTCDQFIKELKTRWEASGYGK
jgi:hypothetical protein